MGNEVYTCTSIQHDIKGEVLKDRGSKFIGYLLKVNNEEEVALRLEELKAEFPDATHHCYAYRLGYTGSKFRANDDGEPGGSAGLPILNQLKSAEITFVLCVVIRYYGGTKLGVGGLIQAYKGCAILAINKAKKVQYHKKAIFQIKFPYHRDNEVRRGIQEFKGEIINQEFLAECSFQIQIKEKRSKEFIQYFSPFEDIEVKLL